MVVCSAQQDQQDNPADPAASQNGLQMPLKGGLLKAFKRGGGSHSKAWSGSPDSDFDTDPEFFPWGKNFVTPAGGGPAAGAV